MSGAAPNASLPLRWSRVAGTGSCLPRRRVTNAELVHQLARQGVETSDAWIVERTGIQARYFAGDDESCSDLAVAAARLALEAADCDAASIDLIIVATSTPDMVFPSTACIVQQKLGVHGCAAFDVQAVCSGFVYALTVADSMIRSGSARSALVIGADVFSRLLDFSDRGTCVLFGDGAGAAGGAPAGAPVRAAPASAAAWRSLRAAQPPRLRGASLGPRKFTRRRGPTASADRCRMPAGGRAVSR